MNINLRKQIGFDTGYHEINREERNLAAIFYHSLLLKNNLNKFINFIKCDFLIVENEMGIYFEYAFIRDLWSSIKNENENENEFKRRLILDFLKPNNRDYLEKISILKFNTHFGAVPKPSDKYIQSPGNWSIQCFNKNIKDNNEFLKVCKFKWAFNAKPDIVIHTSNDKAICIEAKYESKEGKYPSKSTEKKIFRKRDIPLVGQLSIQKKIMELLGIETKFIYLVQKTTSDHYKKNNTLVVTWKEVFDKLNLDNCPNFIKSWVNRLDLLS